ncbi:MAG TPA: triple tyrosine motif-containing protein [Saprospiraceae bacterium]|nr:triple tyrosine motif-containing protein [Saprospiraceae bacterium]
MFQSSNDQVFIASYDGLNIFDGQQMKTYRPLTHHMAGNSMSSPFFEDTAGIVWFTTTEALHYYNPVTDSIDYIFMVSSKGDTLHLEHAAFHLSGNILYLSADKEVFLYDVIKRTIKAIYPVDFSNDYIFAVIEERSDTIFFGANNKGFAAYALRNGQPAFLYQRQGYYTSLCLTASKQLWLGERNGKILRIDPQQGNVLFEFPLSSERITSIVEKSADKLLVTITYNDLVEFDLNRQMVTDRYKPQRMGTKESVDYLITSYLSRDSTLWLAGGSQGVFFCNLLKSKFQHFLNTGDDQKQINITGIIPIEHHRYVIFTRRYGILLINENGEVLHHWTELPGGISYFTSIAAAPLNEHELIFNYNQELYLLNLHHQHITKANLQHTYPQLFFDQIDQLSNGKVIASCRDNLLLEIQMKDNKLTLQPYGALEGHSIYTESFKSDLEGNLYVSNNETSVLVLAPTPNGDNHKFSHELPIVGGLTSLYETHDKQGIYFTNSNGLFFVPKGTKDIDHILDQDYLLNQTIYAVIEDKQGELWLATNSGILKYSPETRKVKTYSIFDGVQAMEFNSHAYLETADGHIFFGGINGLNYFHPDQIHSSTKEAPVYIRGVKINDEIDSTILVPQFRDSYVLPYKRNTISFDFHAIDYADPNATRVKYQLVGVDPEYVESQSAKGFARYANLPHGSYTLLLLGANADGHWNETPRVIEIIVNPPFYLTWWFITLCVLLAIGIIYGAVRMYYQRQLEKRNQIVREQALIIEKQKAVEYERNRIASEMHDDLGSGLTTIRYLSDKALKQARDSNETEQIKRISEHSKRLVRNMSEIIWAMNSRFDTADNLVGYLRRYASEYLEEHQLPLRFVSGVEHLDQVSMGGEKRRNVFLVFKEMLHNTVKYSGAERLEIEITTNHQLIIHITEIGGKGFDPDLALERGNGIFNCKKRMDSVGGELIFEKTAEAMHIHIIVPVKPEAGA